MTVKTVMFITNSGVGLFSFRYEIIKELIAQNYRVFLAYPNGDRRNEFEKIGCKYINVPFNSSSINPIGDIKLFVLLKRIIKRIKPSIALLYTIKPCIYAGFILRKMKIPYVCTVTGISPALISSNPIVRIISKQLSKLGYNGASIVYFQNSMNEELFSRLKIANGKHRLIVGSGVNLEKFGFIDYPKEDGWIKLLYLGRIKRIKGLKELAYAINKAKDNNLRIKCRIVGDFGDDIPELMKMINDGYVEYKGSSNDVREHLAWCDALVLPSYGEGMSNVMQEACSCGRPVLASDIPGCKEIFDEGVTGYGFKPKDGDSLYEAIKVFALTPYEIRKKMAKNARKRMEQSFDRKEVVNIYVNKIKELVGN